MCVLVLSKHSATTQIYTLSLHDALPISSFARRLNGVLHRSADSARRSSSTTRKSAASSVLAGLPLTQRLDGRSEEHTSELQSLRHLVCRLLLEKKNKVYQQRLERCERVW